MDRKKFFKQDKRRYSKSKMKYNEAVRNLADKLMDINSKTTSEEPDDEGFVPFKKSEKKQKK